MKILFLNGSPRKNGYTARAMKCIQEGIGPEHSIEWVNVYDLTIKPCQSCLQCRPNRGCVLPEDDGHGIFSMIRSADALVIGSPTYFGNMSGTLKVLVDRSLTAFEAIAASGLEMPIPLHQGKKAAMVTACNIPYPMSELPNQAKGTLSAMETVLKAGGYAIAGSIIIDAAASKKDIPPEIRSEGAKLGSKLISG